MLTYSEMKERYAKDAERTKNAICEIRMTGHSSDLLRGKGLIDSMKKLGFIEDGKPVSMEKALEIGRRHGLDKAGYILEAISCDLSRFLDYNNPIKPNTKIRILSPEHSEYVQKLAFEAGFSWIYDKPNVVIKNLSCLYFGPDQGISYDITEFFFDNSLFKEIFIDLPSDINSRILAEKVGGKHNHYFKDVSDLDEIDVYRVCDLFDVHDTSGAIHHALKKLLCSGQRGVKDYRKDLEEARDSIQRKLDIMAEDGE